MKDREQSPPTRWPRCNCTQISQCQATAKFSYVHMQRTWPTWKCEDAIRQTEKQRTKAKHRKKNSENLEEMREDVSRECDAQHWSHSHKMWCQGRQLINCFLFIYLVARWHLVSKSKSWVFRQKKRKSKSLKSLQSLFDGTTFDISLKKTKGTKKKTKQNSLEMNCNDEINQSE